MKRVIVAFDPGVTTGFAMAALEYKDELYIDGERPVVTQWPTGIKIIKTGEWRWLERFDHLAGLAMTTSQFDVEAVIIEQFTLFPHAAQSKVGSGFPEIRMIGSIELAIQAADLYHTLVWQQPSLKSSVRLKGIDYWEGFRSSSNHINDALKHLRYYYLMRQRGRKPKQGGKGKGGHWMKGT